MKAWMKNPWVLGLGIPALLTVSGAIGYAVNSHAQDEQQEKRLSDVELVSVKLGKIHEAEEAKREQTIEHCNARIITHCGTCRGVGIDIEECHQ